MRSYPFRPLSNTSKTHWWLLSHLNSLVETGFSPETSSELYCGIEKVTRRWLYCLWEMLWRTFMTKKTTYFVALQGWWDITQTISSGALRSPKSVRKQAFVYLLSKEELFSVWKKCWPKLARLHILESPEICLVQPSGFVETRYTCLILLDSVSHCRFQAENRHVLQEDFFY